jgi:hypothetical protein
MATMKRDVGDKAFPIWLLGDSNPKNWQTILKYPFDPRHPVRHNIWTSITDVVQRRVFNQLNTLIRTESIYIRNAVAEPNLKANASSVEWARQLLEEISTFHELVVRHKPKVLITFGSFAYEFARRTFNEDPSHKYSYWGANKLGEEFMKSVSEFTLSKTNVFPLLHRSISGGKYIQSHEYFCKAPGANYFDIVGAKIAQIIIDNRNSFDIWVRDPSNLYLSE